VSNFEHTRTIRAAHAITLLSANWKENFLNVKKDFLPAIRTVAREGPSHGHNQQPTGTEN